MTNEIKFLIKCYFGDVNDPIRMAVNRAYRDMARTLRVSKAEREHGRIVITEYLYKRLEDLSKDHKNDFDEWHRTTSFEIKNRYEKLTFGQIQKWLNMSIKYLYTLKQLGLDDVDDYYVNNTNKFHAPLDSLILKSVNRENLCWSKIQSYDEYLSIINRITFKSEYEMWINSACGTH